MKKEDNMRVYEAARSVPQHALKTIKGGRLNGFSDVNPMYRIKRMTEVFGPCGIGWYYEITRQWEETYGDEVKCFCNVDLYIKDGEGWSKPIPGTGGSSLVSVERSGRYVSDEGHKMALTDALSVAMKSLGIAADIYYSKDSAPLNPGDSKYRQTEAPAADLEQQAVAEVSAAKSREAFVAVIAKYSKKVPFTPGTPFYEACRKMSEKYPKPS